MAESFILKVPVWGSIEDPSGHFPVLKANGTGFRPFEAHREKEGSSDCVFYSITMQFPYHNFSFEGLRLADYLQGRKFANSDENAVAHVSRQQWPATVRSQHKRASETEDLKEKKRVKLETTPIKQELPRDRIICPVGDLELLVGRVQQAKLRVSSHVLVMASKVFEKMLGGDFKEAQLLER